MKNLFDARLSFYSIGLIISSTIERLITSVINSYLILASVYYHMISLSILIVLFILTNYFLKPLTQQEFITKMILGKKYIGGRWVEIVITENNEISHITKMDISYDNDKLKLHGDCYQNGLFKYNFDSACASLDNYNLTYVFIAYEKIPRRDVGCLLFEQSGGKPSKYSGHFEDKGMEFRVAGILITDLSIIEKMNEDFIETVEQDILPNMIKIHKLHKLNIHYNNNIVTNFDQNKLSLINN